jgi:hypothetical protein
VSINVPYSGLWAVASTDDNEESDVEEAEGRGESTGETSAVGGAERSDSVVVVTDRRKAGFLGRETAVFIAMAVETKLPSGS